MEAKRMTPLMLDACGLFQLRESAKARDLIGLEMAGSYNNTEINIEYEHTKIHQGLHYEASNYDSNVDTAAAKKWLFIAPSSDLEAHIIFEITAENEILIEVFKDPIVSNNGTPIIRFNSKYLSEDDSQSTTFKNPTTTDDGTRFYVRRLGSGKQRGGFTRRPQEMIIENGMKILFKITTDANDNIVDFNINWYEE